MILILDLILIVIFALCVVTGYKNGLIKTVVRLFGGLIAFLLARIIAATFSSSFAKILPMPSLGQKVSESVTSAINGSDTLLTVGDVLKKIGAPESIVNNMKDSLSATVSSGAEQVATQITDALASMIAYALLFLISFVVIALLLKLVCVWMNIFSKLPLIRTANTLLGGIFGVISGLFFAWLTAIVLSWLGPVFAGLFDFDISAFDTTKTYIFQYLAGYNPLGILFGSK